MNTTDIKFKNLDIGYYFIYNDKAYVKINDHSAIILFSYLESPLFTNVNSVYNSIDYSGNYTQPSHLKIIFQPEEIIKFITREELKNYLVSEFINKGRRFVLFSEIPIGSYFYNKKEDKFYKKISYNYALPILKSKIGLDDSERIAITIVSSASNTTNEFNRIYYNGDKLIDLDLKSWNVITFSSNFKSFTVKSFDTRLNWNKESKSLLRYISEIDDETLTIICNSNDSETAAELTNRYNYLGHFSKIIDENYNALDVLNSVGLNKNTIETISKNDTLLIASLKGKEILNFQKLEVHSEKYDFKNSQKYNFLEYIYSYETSQKQHVPSTKKEINLDEEVTEVSFYEITTKMLFDLNDNDIRSYCDYDLFDV